MQHSKKSWLNIFNRKDKLSSTSLWTPETEEDDVTECHNPWLSLNRDTVTNDSSSTARFI